MSRHWSISTLFGFPTCTWLCRSVAGCLGCMTVVHGQRYPCWWSWARTDGTGPVVAQGRTPSPRVLSLVYGRNGGCRWCHPCITRHGVHSMRDTWRGLVERQESDEVGWLHSDSLPVACHTLGAGGKGQHPRTSNPGGCVGQGANQNVHGVVWVTKIRFTTDDDSRVPKDGNKVCEEDVVNRRDESKVDDLRRDPEQPVDVHRLDKVLVHVLFPLCL